MRRGKGKKGQSVVFALFSSNSVPGDSAGKICRWSLNDFFFFFFFSVINLGKHSPE